MKLLKLLKKSITNREQENLTEKLLHGVFWNLVSAMASQGFPMIAAIFTARLLGKFGYGQLGMINSTVILFSTFAGLGLGITSTRYIAQLHKTDPEKTGRVIGLIKIFGFSSGILMCILFFLIAPWLASNALAAPDLSLTLQIASILLILNTIVGIQSGVIVGFGAFKNLARIAIIQGLISATLTIIGVYFFGLLGAIVAMVINSFINMILYHLTLNNLLIQFKISIDYVKSWSEREILWKQSFPTMLSTILVGPVIWVANIIIIHIPGGYSQLGIFNAADQWRNALTFLPLVVGGVLLPMLANVNERNEKLETINVFIGWFLVIIIGLPLLAFPEIISFFYGSNFGSSDFISVLALMIFVSFIISYQDGISRKLIVNDLMWWGFLDNIIWAIIFLLSVVTLKNLGAIGLALSYIISYIIKTLIFVPFYLWKDVVPKSLLISKKIIIIWVVLSIETLVTVCNVSILLRTVFLILSTVIVLYSLRSYWI